MINRVTAGGAVLLCLLLLLAAPVRGDIPYPAMPAIKDLVPGYCSRVVDGDTAYIEIVDDGIPVAHMYRLIGVDTPETVHPHLPVQPYGMEASEFTKAHLLSKWVYVEYDAQKTDDYQRHLGYIWLRDGSLFNLILLEEGYGKFMVYPPNVKYSGFLLEGQKRAQQAQKGIWSPAMTSAGKIDLTALSLDELLALQARIAEELFTRAVPYQ